MLIAVEGKNKTEKQYFSAFKAKQKKYSIIFVPGNFTDPANMAESIVKHMEKVDFNEKYGDIAYCVFDLDADQGKLSLVQNALDQAKTKKFNCIISNPCFEVWFLCHYEYSTRHYPDPGSVIKQLKKSLPEYTKDMNIIPILEINTESAIENAKSLMGYHVKENRLIGSLDANPITEVHLIVEKLIK